MKTDLPWFQFHWPKWLLSRKVRAMSHLQRGIFLHLLLEQWQDGPIPDDLAVIANLVGMPQAQLEVVWPSIRAAFTEKDGMLQSDFLESIRAHHIARYEQAVAAGSKGGRPPKGKPKPEGLAGGLADGKHPVSKTEPDEKRVDRVDRIDRKSSTATGRVNAPSPLTVKQLDGRPLEPLPEKAEPRTPEQQAEWDAAMDLVKPATYSARRQS